MLQSDLTRMTSSPGQLILSNHLVKNVAAHQFCMLKTLLLYIKMRRGQEGSRKEPENTMAQQTVLFLKHLFISGSNLFRRLEYVPFLLQQYIKNVVKSINFIDVFSVLRV